MIGMKQYGILLAGLAALSMTGCNRGGSNLAVINGEAITMQQFYNYLESKPQVQVVMADGTVTSATVSETLAFQALQDLIRQKVIVQLAKDRKLAPTKEEVEKEVKFQIDRDSTFIPKLKDRGLNLNEIKESLEVDLAREKLLSQNIELRDEDVDVFIKANPKEFTMPATFDAKWIFVKDESEMRESDREINAGSSFSTVARKYSKDPNVNQNQGSFPNRNLDAMPAELRSKIAATAVGKETGWIRLQDGWAKFLIEDRKEASKIVPSKEQKMWLKRQLTVQKGLLANDLDQKLLEKLRKASVDVSYTELKSPWKNAFDKLKEAGPKGDKAAEEGKTGTATGR